jgi:hypothetical protein
MSPRHKNSKLKIGVKLFLCRGLEGFLREGGVPFLRFFLPPMKTDKNKNFDTNYTNAHKFITGKTKWGIRPGEFVLIRESSPERF